MPTDTKSFGRAHRVAAMKTMGNVILALILRDIRTRFFGHGLGFLLAIAWPLAHVIAVSVIWASLGRATPYGESAFSFFACTLAPALTVVYMSRFTSYSALQNKSLMWFPVVQPLDILIARVILETLSSVLMLIFLFIFLKINGKQAWPENPVVFFTAMALAIQLGASLGFFSGVLTFLFPSWATINALFCIVIYATSGAIYNIEAFPQDVIYYFSWNPVLHPVEMARSSFFSTYTSQAVNIPYVIYVSLALTVSALFLERRFRSSIKK